MKGLEVHACRAELLPLSHPQAPGGAPINLLEQITQSQQTLPVQDKYNIIMG